MIGNFLHLSERFLQLLQGKGIGARTVRLEARVARRFMSESSTVFDVGANKGAYTKALLRSAGDKIRSVHLFEPSLANYRALAELSDARLVVNHLALGAKSERRPLYSDTPGSPLASLYQRNLRHRSISFGTQEAVDVGTLDEYVASRNIETIDLLKIDVEGHELEVMLGAQNSLKRKVRAVQFEFGGCNLDSRTLFRDFWILLSDHGFRIASLSPFFGLLEIDSYTESRECFTTTNYFAYRS